MVALHPMPVPVAADQRVWMHGLTWAQYEALLAVRGERAAPRITYLEGTVELMSPSLDHEYVKTNLGRLIEAWALRHRVRLLGFGSWTLKREAQERGLEPDECYVVGKERKDRPDIAVEVVFTSGGISKLEVYRGLGVPEVWIWEAGRLEVWVLEGDGYARRPRSSWLPDLDVPRLAQCALMDDPLEAVDAFLGD